MVEPQSTYLLVEREQDVINQESKRCDYDRSGTPLPDAYSVTYPSSD